MSTRQQTFFVSMTQPNRPIYLDCAATSPIDPRVRDVLLHYIDVEFGNAGSRSHIFGQEAAKGVRNAREQIAAVVNARANEVIFTSGATEANNLAILGLAAYGKSAAKRHVISTLIEHKAVLEPLEFLADQGFEVDLVEPLEAGYIDPQQIARRLRPDTLLVSTMHVNNETGIVQPIAELAEILKDHDSYFHVDAAQGFGKELVSLSSSRIDLISCSGHKLYSPKGIGCLVTRRQRKVNRKLSPLVYGGGHERGLRPGTLPTALIAAFGKSAELAHQEHLTWSTHWRSLLSPIEKIITEFQGTINGDPERQLGNILNFSIPTIGSDLMLLTLKNIASISTGSACTSAESRDSHVITAMYGSDSFHASTACRLSVSHLTESIPYDRIRNAIRGVC